METTKYEIVHYFDTYNVAEEDGAFDWIVNNQCSEGFIELPDELSGDDFRQALINGLISKNLLVPHVKLSDLEFTDSGEWFEILDARDFQPLFQIRSEA